MEPTNVNTQIPYRCIKVTEDPEKYGLKTWEFERADGYGGWFNLTGCIETNFEVGKVYQFSSQGLPEGICPKCGAETEHTYGHWTCRKCGHKEPYESTNESKRS